MKKPYQNLFLLLLFLFTGILQQAQAQNPKLPGFNLIWNFCDANGTNLRLHEDVCVGETVYIINQSRYGHVNGANGAWPIGSRLVDGTYTFASLGSPGFSFSIPAANWTYNQVYSFTAPSYQSHTSSNPLNVQVTYTATSSRGATTAPLGRLWRQRKGYFHTSPQPTVNAYASPANVCPGSSTTLSTSGNWSSYQWSTGATTSTINVSPAVPTTYSVTVSNSNGCTATKNISVGILSNQLTVNSTYNICADDYPVICPPEATRSTQWYLNANQQSMLVYTGDCFIPLEAGNYTVVHSSPCFAFSNFDVVEVGGQLNPAFNISTAHMGTYYSITANAVQTSFPSNVPGVGFFWMVKDLTNGCDLINYSKWWGGAYPAIANGFTNNFPEFESPTCQPNPSLNTHGRFEFDHTYKFIRGLWSDCDSWTASSVTITIGSRSGIIVNKKEELTHLDEYEIQALKDQLFRSGALDENGWVNEPIESKSKVSSLEVFPNPNNGNFSIALPANLAPTASIAIMDLTGKIILSKAVFDTREEFNISDQPKGIYLIKLNNGDQMFTQKIVVR